MKKSLREALLLWTLSGVAAFGDVNPIMGPASLRNNHLQPDIATSKNNDSNERVVTVLMSDRIEGILPTLGSLVDASSSDVDVVLIGDTYVNEHARKHFEGRINSFRLLTIDDVESDLLAQGIIPIWKWDEFGASHDPHWSNENTIHLASWDGLATHENKFNHARFYLPYLSALQDVEHFFLIDDDLIIKADLGSVARTALDMVADGSKGLICPCNIWMWNGECSKYEFKEKEEGILDSPPLYGTAATCTHEAQENCVPESFDKFLDTVAQDIEGDFEEELAWNFGFCFVPKANWQKLELTQRYESVMKASYKDHVFPENSLAYGLGVSYLAFTGSLSCWDDDHVKVRDGFGFIPPHAFEESIGYRFVDKLDVLHYTGPEKPWTPNATIREENLKPWFAAMEREGLELPAQFSGEPAKEVFSVLTSWRSGSEWVLNQLDQHPHICASGEAFSPQEGFPTEALNIYDLPDVSECSVKIGCSLRFVLDNIADLTEGDSTTDIPPRCEALFSHVEDLPRQEWHEDPLPRDHLERLCNFVALLDGDYSATAITNAWVDAFVSENQNLMGCTCPLGTQIKGLKVMNDWLVDRDGDSEDTISTFHETAFAGSKVIRFKRENLFERYKSILTAEYTGIWHARTDEDADERHNGPLLYLPINEMLEDLEDMEYADQVADAWARDFASDVLWVDYENCRKDPLDCFNGMFEFLGVEKLNTIEEKIFRFSNQGSGQHLLDSIENKDEVREALIANGWGHFIGEEETYRDLQLLIYETDPILTSPTSASSLHYFESASGIKGITTTVFGQNTVFRGFGSKYSAVEPYLVALDPEDLVIISDGRDVLINVNSEMDGSYGAIADFKNIFQELTEEYPNAIVMSAEAQCCVTALTHIQPGDLFDSDGNRKAYTCDSGGEGCHWAGSLFAAPWESFMENLAQQRGYANVWDVYLNAGLMAGRAKDLLDLVNTLNMQESEDDQAVLTDFLFHNPDMIVLDYEQRLFGSNRWADGMEGEGCMFELDEEGERLSHIETLSRPLLIHSNGEFFECQDELEDILEDEVTARELEDTPSSETRELTVKSTKAPNYKSTKAPNYGSTKAPKTRALKVKSTKAPNYKSTKAPKTTSGRRLKSTKAPNYKSTKAPNYGSTKAPKAVVRRLKSTKAPNYKSTKAPNYGSTKAPKAVVRRLKSTKAPNYKSTKAPNYGSTKAPKAVVRRLRTG